MAEHQDNRRNPAVVPSGQSSLPRSLAAAAERAAQQPYGTAITASETAISEARACLPAWRDKLRPASENNRKAILFALSDVMGKPDVLRNGDAKAQTVFWNAYHADLGHLPAIVLSRACAAWRRSGEAWFPTPGQLLILARQDEEWRHDHAILKGLDRLAKARSEEARREPTQAELDHIASLMGDLRKRVGAAETSAHDEANSEALAWYRSPRDWSKHPVRGAA